MPCSSIIESHVEGNPPHFYDIARGDISLQNGDDALYNLALSVCWQIPEFLCLIDPHKALNSLLNEVLSPMAYSKIPDSGDEGEISMGQNENS